MTATAKHVLTGYDNDTARWQTHAELDALLRGESDPAKYADADRKHSEQFELSGNSGTLVEP